MFSPSIASSCKALTIKRNCALFFNWDTVSYSLWLCILGASKIVVGLKQITYGMKQ